MKKIFRIMSFVLCMFAMTFIFSACDEEDTSKKILVDEISLSKTEITLYTSNSESSSEDIEIFFKPENANSLDVQFFSYDESLIKIEQKENSGFVFTVSAINFGVQDQTTLGVRMKGNTNVQASCVVKVKKINERLDAPTNIQYDVERKQLTWEEPACASFEDFNGYEVELFEEGVEGSQKIVCPTTNSLNIDAKGKKITARVKTLSQLKSYDSEYSRSYSFKVLDDIKEVSHNAGLITWGEVAGVSGYKYILNGNSPIILDKQIRNYSQTFSTAGKYAITIEEVVENEINQNGNVSCYVFGGKSKTIYVTKFETPVLNFDSYFSWEAIIADGLMPENYELSKLTNTDNQTYEVVQSSKLLSYLPPEDLSVGTHTYRLRAVGNGKDTLSSEYSAIKVVNKIEKPTNLRVENGVITWDRASTAVAYNLSISGLIGGTNSTFVTRISQPDQTQTKVQYILGNSYSGEYRIKVVSVGSEQATLNSASTEEIVVTKLSAPEKASFTLTNNVVEWAEQTGASRYKLILNINNEEVVKEVETNRYVIDELLNPGQLSLKVCAIGSDSQEDNTFYITGEYSQNVYAQKLSTPMLSVQGGKIIWTTPINTLGFVLHINNGTDLDKDFEVGMLTSFDFYEISEEIFGDITHFDAGTYSVSIKALGGNASGVIGTFDSDVSEELQVTKRETPQVSLVDGEIKVVITDEASNTQVIKKENTDGSTTYSYYSLGDNTEYIRSDVSNEITVISRTKDVHFRMENGVLYWDEIGEDYVGATYEFKLNGEILEDVGERTTITSKDFSLLDAGNYSVSIKVIGTTSGIHSNLILTNSQTDTFTFKKLASTELSVLNAQSVLQATKIDENKLPGTIIWQEVDNALGYRLTIKHSGETINLDVHQTFFNLTNYEAGTYTMSIKPYGNNGNIINGDESEEIEVVKLDAPTNLAIDNDGKLSWKTNSSYIGMIANAKVIFAVVINGNYYTFYDFAEISAAMNSYDLDVLSVLKDTECDISCLYSFNNLKEYVEFPAGEYTACMVAIPLNFKETIGEIPLVTVGDHDTYSNFSQQITFTILEQPYGLRIDQNDEGDYIASWTNHFDENISKYQLYIKDNNKEHSGEYIDIDEGTSFNLNEYLNGKDISNYKIAVRALTESANHIHSDYSNPVEFKMLNHLNISINDGKLKWSKIDGAQKYILTFENTITGETFDVEFEQNETEYAMSLEDDERFVASVYNIKGKVIGNDSSENLSMFYMDTFDIKDFGDFQKLNTPTNLHVNKGVVVYECIDVPANFNLYFSGAKTDTVDNGVKFSYELEEKFNAGEYGLTIQAMGGNDYIDSEISASIEPETVIKLPAPVARVEDGLLKWTSVDNSNGYLIRLSGAIFYVYDEESGEFVENSSTQHFEFAVSSVNSIDLSRELIATDGTQFRISFGEYSVQVKALGTNTTYLNSNFSTKGTVKKLKQITDFDITNGVLTWKKLNSGDAPNGIYLFVKIGDASEYEEPILISNALTNSYDFKDEKYNGKQLEVYMQIIGDKTKVLSNATANINGSPSDEIAIEKLSTPTGTAIVATAEQGCFGRYTFDACDKEGTTYEVKIIVTAGDWSREFTRIITDNYIDLNSEDFENVEISENTQFDLSVRYLGNDNYINSEFSETLTIVVPKTPSLELVMDEHNRFTGKVVWNKIDSGNVETKYVMYVEYINEQDAINNSIMDISQIEEEDWQNIGETKLPYQTTLNKYYVYGRGYYRFSIASVLSIGDSGNQITSKQSAVSQAVVYRIFESGSGEVDNPFMVDSVDSFNAIRYNLTAHYKLKNDISFIGQTLYQIGLEDDMFTGSFDGNNKTLSNITKADVIRANSIFGYVGSTGVIKNVKIENIIITNGTYIGGIVGYNAGTIQNVIIGSPSEQYTLNPNSTGDQTTMVGGIAGYNMGTIDSCINYMIVAPRNENAVVYTGGIAGFNLGIIENCKNYASVGGLGKASEQIGSNISGGIVGYNQYDTENEDLENLIQNCYNYGSVFATSRNYNKILQHAYSGGIVGFNKLGILNRCFNDNSNGIYTEADIRSATTIFAITTTKDCPIYVGGLVGYNEKEGRVEGKVTNCYTLSNIDYDNGGTSANIYVGAIFGQNKATATASINTIYYFTFNTSITNDAGSVLPTIRQDIYGYKQGVSGSFSDFTTAVGNKLGIAFA